MTARPTVILALTPLAEREFEPLLFDSDAPLALLSSVVGGRRTPTSSRAGNSPTRCCSRRTCRG